MTQQDFYKDRYALMTETRRSLEEKAERFRTGEAPGGDVQPVVYFCSRIKSPESMKRKLSERGYPVNAASALENVYDAVGLRIVCSFAGDVQYVVEALEADPDIEVIEKKDYLSRPKPNGYRSIHLCIRLRPTGLLAEIQVRTIAMDFWATLEHQLKYKKSVKSEALIRSELKRCADEIASADLSMQTIREILKEM